MSNNDYKCGVCGFVGHESEFESLRGYRRKECPKCNSSKDNAYPLD